MVMIKKLFAATAIVATAGIGATTGAHAAEQRCSGLIVWGDYGKDLGCDVRPPQQLNIRIDKFADGGYSWAVNRCNDMGGTFTAPAGRKYICYNVDL